MKSIVVFWEDSFSRRKDFGPHVLALQCLLDRHPTIALTSFALQTRVRAVATNGIDKMLRKVRLVDEQHVIAVPDNDKIRRTLDLSPAASDAEVLERLQAINARAHFVLLHRNMEDVLVHAHTALGEKASDQKQRPLDRDRVIFRLAADSPQARQAFLVAMPSFRRIVETLEQLLGTHLRS